MSSPPEEAIPTELFIGWMGSPGLSVLRFLALGLSVIQTAEERRRIEHGLVGAEGGKEKDLEAEDGMFALFSRSSTYGLSCTKKEKTIARN